MAIIVRKNKKGPVTYQVKVRDVAGVWFPTSSFQDREAAVSEELRLLKLRRQGARAIGDDAKKVSLDEYWSVWSVENRSRSGEGWRISQDQMFRDYVSPVLGSMKLIEIQTPEIGRCLKRARDMGRSEQMVKHVYSLLRSMFGDAVEYYEMLASNPVKAKFHRPKVSKKKRNFLPPDLAWKLLSHCRSHYAGPAIWLQTLAAMRCEAAIPLEFGAIQWDLDQILIRRAWKQKVGRVEEFPKGKDWEYVPMIPKLKAYLWEHWERSGRDPHALVCRNFRGTEMLTYNTYHKVLTAVCRDAGLPRVTTHELRHSSTEIWVQAGATTEDIRRLLHHRSVTTTMNYIHRTDDRLRALAARVDSGTMFPNSFPNGNKEPYAKPEQEAAYVH